VSVKLVTSSLSATSELVYPRTSFKPVGRHHGLLVKILFGAVLSGMSKYEPFDSVSVMLCKNNLQQV
jgi:hypothetical protein